MQQAWTVSAYNVTSVDLFEDHSDGVRLLLEQVLLFLDVQHVFSWNWNVHVAIPVNLFMCVVHYFDLLNGSIMACGLQIIYDS